MTFTELLTAAQTTSLQGWDFSVFGDRFSTRPPDWDYRAIVARYLARAGSLLDLGTGGGEFLSTMDGLPSRTVATEGWPPNVPLARERLQPLGVEVVALPDESEPELPFGDAEFDLVINRHESYSPTEVARILRPAGVFVTQQVGGGDLKELNEVLNAPPPEHRHWSLEFAARQLCSAGLHIVDSASQRLDAAFADIGAVALYLRICPWQIPGYQLDAYRDRLRRLHDLITSQGDFRVTEERFYLVARRYPSHTP